MSKQPSGGQIKVALVMSGAVSLGTYEAGVIFEFLKAMEDQARTGVPDLAIDVVVGASAGSINGALLAYILMMGAEKKLLHDVWVKSFSLQRLKKSGRDSLVDGGQISKLLTEVMTGEGGQSGKYGSQEEMLLTVALTNLDGIKYLITPSKEGKVIETYSFVDQLKFAFRPGEKAASTWAKVIEGVQASSAFPVVFEPVQISREPGEYPPWLSPPTITSLKFTYVDGGIVDNRPLGLAIDGALTKELGPGDERLFLLVEPDPPEVHIRSKDHYNMLDSAAASLWSIPTYDSIFQEIAQIAKINQRIDWLEGLLTGLEPWLAQQLAKLDSREISELNELLKDQCRKIAGEWVRRQQVYTRNNNLNWEEETNRYLEGELARIIQKRGFRKANVAPFLVFILEHLSNLSKKEELKVERIMPTNPTQELAGEFFAHFGGALDQRMREHDFRTGRLAGRKWLEEKSIVYQPDAEEEYKLEPGFSQVSWLDLPLATRIDTIFFALKTLIRIGISIFKVFRRRQENKGSTG